MKNKHGKYDMFSFKGIFKQEYDKIISPKEYLYFNEQNGQVFILIYVSDTLYDCIRTSFFDPFTNEGDLSWVRVDYINSLQKEGKITYIGEI